MPIALEEMEDFLGDGTRGVNGEVGARDNCRFLSVDHPGNSATLARKRAVGGNNDLPDFKHTELEVSSWNLVESVQQAAVTGGDRGLTRTRGADGKFIRVAVIAGE